jgi:two-component system, NarL family, sensor histidine kinase UhpB
MGVPLKVLLVEDSENDALLLLRELKRGGYEPEFRRVDTAAEMDSALESEAWDLVVSDHSMPAFNSHAALDLLRGKGFLDLPFIIVSGQIGEDAAVSAMKAGAHDYLMKNNLARLNTAIERELREAEVRRSRREAEAKYRSIFEDAVEGIFQTTADGEFVIANPALARMYGYDSPEELLQKVTSIGDQIYADPGRREEFVRIVKRDGLVQDFEMRVQRGDGKTSWTSVNARAMRDEEGTVVGFEGFVKDITEQKRAEEALGEIREAERRRIARELHDVVLQDLTYALQSLRVTPRMPEGADREAESRRQVEALRRSVAGIRDAIYDLRLQGAGEQTLARSLESIVELNRQLSPGCTFELSVGEGFPADLRGPLVVEVARVVQEALANVRRHSGAGHAAVRLSATGDEARVEVEDDGRGFAAGTAAGMGLTGMRERAAALGGQVEVEGNAGSGTRVSLRAPLTALTGTGDVERANA